jgi:hypothetical protein
LRNLSRRSAGAYVASTVIILTFLRH